MDEKFYDQVINHHYLDLSDLILTPIYIFIFYIIALQFKNKIKNKELTSFFIPAFSVKMFGAVIAGLIYQFYYKAGDTFAYFTSAAYIGRNFFKEPLESLELIFFSDPIGSSPYLYKYGFLDYIDGANAWFVVRVAGIFTFFSFNTYMVIALFFSVFSFFAAWEFFSLLCKIYPDSGLHKKFAYCIFFIPSVFFWGSGIFKDTLTLGALLLFTTHIYFILFKRQYTFKHFAFVFLAIYILASIRLFFVIILVPCVLFWWFAEIRNSLITNNLLRAISFPILLVLSVVFIGNGLSNVLSNSKEFNKEAIENKAHGFQDWHGSLGGSAYDLGVEDFSTSSLYKAIIPAINVTLFRPYVWETHTFFQLITSLQSLFFFYFFIKTLFQSGFSFFGKITSDPLVLFCISFSLIYAFVAGFTSYNFGALDRYKIPALPFFMLTLVLVSNKKVR